MKEEQKLQQNLEEKLYQRNTTRFGIDLNPVVSIVTGVFVLMLTIYAFISITSWWPFATAYETFDRLQSSIVSNLDWVFIFSANFFIILSLYMAFSKLGRVRLGGLKAKPEFSTFAWYSMLISAGMGIGLMFWAVGEPLSHMANTPPIYQGDNPAFTALATTFLHWGIHPWAIYSIIALALSYFAYNKKLPLSIRSIFYPIFKERVFGVVGDVIDILAVLATLFGLATSLGLGVQQVNSGLNYLIGIPISTGVQVFLIAAITLVATISIMSGIDKGVKFLSKMNMRIAFILMVLIFLLGPTAYIIRLFSNSLGLYFSDIIPASLHLSMGEGSWEGAWTVFYLAWWISWSPFVGMFIARVSKGRTIREFIIAVLVVPSMLSFVWLSVFGGTAFYVDEVVGGDLTNVVVNEGHVEIAFFRLINDLVGTFSLEFIQGIIAVVLATVGTVLVISFFVTSSDSGSIVVNTITSSGKTNTPRKQRVFWAAVEGLIAALLLVIGGNEALNALQAAVIITGLPFALVLATISLSLVSSLNSTYRRQKKIRDTKQIVGVIEEKTDIDIQN